MGREILYRNIALLGSFALLLNIVMFDHVKRFIGLSLFIEWITVPITVIFAAFWIRKRIVLVSVIFFIIGFTLDLALNYLPIYGESNHPIANKIQTAFSVVGLLLMIFAIFSNSEKGWLMKKIHKVELYVMLMVVIIPSFIFLLFLFLL